MAMNRPTILASENDEELIRNLFLLVGDESAKVQSPEEQKATFFKNATFFLSRHEYYPVTRTTMTQIINIYWLKKL